MINKETLIERRNTLANNLPNQAILLLSAPTIPRNYPHNTHPFHQDSTFLYYTNLRLPNAALLFEPNGTQTLFLAPQDPDDLIWTGPTPSNDEIAQTAGFNTAKSIELLPSILQKLPQPHYILPYHPQNILDLQKLLNKNADEIIQNASNSLMLAIVNQRIIKSPDEILEIEEAIALSSKMLLSAQTAIKAGATEADICAHLLIPANAQQRQQAFPPIVTVHGEILHNESMHHTLQNHHILLIDSGVESKNGYCSDITRCFPVSGSYTQKQQEIYNAVLNVQLSTIEFSKQKTITNRDLHNHAAKILAQNLIDLNLMTGNSDEIIETAAYALFMPHGIGHLLGLDVHDMENFKDLAGYDPGDQRSKQFGPNALRLAKTLQPGFVITIEPGIYFIPELIKRWNAENKFSHLINYKKLEQYMDFGGIRIEDDILITPDGSRVLGTPIPK